MEEAFSRYTFNSENVFENEYILYYMAGALTRYTLNLADVFDNE